MAQPGNLLSDNNESCETSVAGWGALASCVLTNSSSQAYAGTKSCLATSNASTPAVAFGSASQSDQPAGLTVGQAYDAWVWVFTTVSGRNAWFAIDWRTSGNVFISTSDQSGAKVNLTANQWTLVQYKTVVAPSTTTQATINFNITQSATSEAYFCDMFFFGIQRPRVIQPPRFQPIVRSNFW